MKFKVLPVLSVLCVVGVALVSTSSVTQKESISIINDVYAKESVEDLVGTLPAPASVEVVEEELDVEVVTREVEQEIVDLPEEVEESEEEIVVSAELTDTNESQVHTVPFYSQFADITPVNWKKIGCGIASLAMLINFYEPEAASVDQLLQEGIAADAYLNSAGWIHSGLINLSKKYGLTGASHSLAEFNMSTAFDTLIEVLEDGPVMASVHYTFDPKNPIPHLVVVNGVKDGMVYYNDPAETSGGGTVSITQFKSAWKKRYIEIRPTLL